MAIKKLDPDDMYIVREMFGCGHGHVMPPGFTHWESGEACIYVHGGEGPTTNESAHLYWRLVCVPVVDGRGADMWDKLCAEPNRWAHLALAPPGAKEGDIIGTKIKLRQGVSLNLKIRARYKLINPEIVPYDPEPMTHHPSPIENASTETTT